MSRRGTAGGLLPALPSLTVLVRAQLQVFVRESSMVPVYAVLLFGGKMGLEWTVQLANAWGRAVHSAGCCVCDMDPGYLIGRTADGHERPMSQIQRCMGEASRHQLSCASRCRIDRGAARAGPAALSFNLLSRNSPTSTSFVFFAAGSIEVQHEQGLLRVDGWARFKAPARIAGKRWGGAGGFHAEVLAHSVQCQRAAAAAAVVPLQRATCVLLQTDTPRKQANHSAFTCSVQCWCGSCATRCPVCWPPR